MNKKIFLTSAVIMCMACPAIAENFPGDGNMLENKTYDNAATYTNTGIYEGTVVANADYSDNQYYVTAGNYLPAASENSATLCLAGSYCPGSSNTALYYDPDNNQGIESCPTGFDNSLAGSISDTQCYRACDINNMGANGTIATIAHAATLTGNDYYGNGTDTCEPATCVSGWHLKTATPGLNVRIGTEPGENSAYVSNTGTFNQRTFGGTDRDQAFYGITANNTWAVYYGTTLGMVTGQARCSTVQGVGSWNWPTNSAQNPTSLTTSEMGVEGGQYCYCNVTEYKQSDGTLQSFSSPWVYEGQHSNNCDTACAGRCASEMTSTYMVSIAFRNALLEYVGASPASCEANTITITWNDASAEDIAATGAATTVYEGDIKTPLKAVTKPGKTFVGWKFIKTQQ